MFFSLNSYIKNGGFTLVETLVGILLTALFTSSLMVGLTGSKLAIESIKTKEIAFDKLKIYTENLKSQIATGVDNFIDSPQGTETVLQYDKDGNPILTASIHKNVIKSPNSGDYSIYYYFHTYIVWQDAGRFYFEKDLSSDHLDTLEFKGYQIRFNL